MASSTTHRLFGGALMSAGIATGVSAQTFEFQDDSAAYASNAYVSVSLAGDAFEELVVAPASLNLSRTAIGGGGALTARTSVEQTSFSVDLLWNGIGPSLGPDAPLGSAVLFQNFTVDTAAELVIEWDFRGTQAFGLTDPHDGISITNVDDNQSIVFQATSESDPLTGISTLELLPDTQYIAYLNIGRLVTNTDLNFARVALVPAPGAPVVMAALGVAASRRRR